MQSSPITGTMETGHRLTAIGDEMDSGASDTTCVIDALDTRRNPAILQAVAELVPLLYQELRQSARRERRRLFGGETLATTALVNELYLRLARHPGFGTRGHFLGVAAIAMRRILIERARAQTRQKRGGELVRVPLDEQAEGLTVANGVQLLAVNDALQALAQRSPRLAEIVECRFFAGYSEPETAEALGISERTVQRDWATARAWLQRELDASAGD